MNTELGNLILNECFFFRILSLTEMLVFKNVGLV